MIRVRGKWEDRGGYNSDQNGWYGMVEHDDSGKLQPGVEAKVFHDSERAWKSTAAGPLVIEQGMTRITVDELGDENAELREFEARPA